MTTYTGQRILIIGGGIGGLTLAAFLQRGRSTVTLAERAAAWRPVGAGISLGPNAVGTLDQLGIGAVLRARGVQLRRGILADAGGSPLSVVDLEEIGRAVGLPTLAIHRAGLHTTLLEAIDTERVAIRLGTEATALDAHADGVEVTFNDGTRERFDLVVAADGIHSAVRTRLFGESNVRYSGYVCWRFVVDGVTLDAPDVAQELWGRGKRFGIVPVGERSVYGFATMNEPRGRGAVQGVTRDEFVELFSEFGGEVPKVLRALAPDHHLILDDIADHPTVRWSRGPVVLLGDAAHATTPNLGQGAAMAIEDAMVLAGTLGRYPTISEALSAYEAARNERVTQITARSWSLGRIGQTDSAAGVFLRNLAMRMVPDRIAQRSNIRLVLDAPDPAMFVER